MATAKTFTFVELLLTLAIIGILAGLVLPPLWRSKNTAGFDRWLKYNEYLNQKSGTVVNFNFQEYGYKLNIDGVMTPCVENLASSSNFQGFDAKKYPGIMVNNPEWLPHGGRWYEKGALQFNGADQCLYIPGVDALDFLWNKHDFTIYLWVYYYSQPSGTVFAKGEEDDRLQYAMFMYDSTPQVIAGRKELHCNLKITSRKWHCLAMVHKAGAGLKIFIDGEGLVSKEVKSKLGVDFKNGEYLTIGALSKVVERNVVNSRSGKTEIKKYYRPAACFRGKIDEVVIMRRAMSDEEINYVYQIGKSPKN